MTAAAHDVTRWARAAFRDGFVEDGVMRAPHRRETALGLVYATAAHGVRSAHLRAFALALRDIADGRRGPGLSASQREALGTLEAGPALPAALAAIVRAARPHLQSAADLDVFAGIAAGAVEAAEVVCAVLEGLDHIGDRGERGSPEPRRKGR